MVLSLGFILAFIGAAVALLIGILIFSEVSDSIICPAGEFVGGGGPSGPSSATEIAPGFQVVHLPFNAGDQGDNKGTLGASGDAQYFEGGSLSTFVDATGPTNLGNAVRQNGTASGDTQGEIRIGSIGSTFNFLHIGNTGNNVTSINFWINGDVVGAPEYTMVSNLHNNAGGTNGIQLFTQSGSMQFRLEEGGGVRFGSLPIRGDEPNDDSNWHMVTVIWDKGNSTGVGIIGCVDAVCQNTASFSLPFTGTGGNPTFALTIGAVHFWSSHVENSWDVDDFTIWNGWQLTQTEIDTMYAGGEGLGATVAAQQGSAECEGAKDTAWTVIGILPVALFFALFAIFGALGRNN